MNWIGHLHFGPATVADKQRLMETNRTGKAPSGSRLSIYKQIVCQCLSMLLFVGCIRTELGLKESIQRWNDLIEEGQFEQLATQMFDPTAVEKNIAEFGKEDFVQSIKDRRDLYIAIFTDVSKKEPDIIFSWGIKVANFKFDHEISGYYAVAFKQINGRWVMHSLYKPGQELLQNDKSP